MRPVSSTQRIVAAVAAFSLLLGASPRVAAARPADECVAAAESAQSLQRKGSLREARTRLLVCSRDVCPGVVQTDCKHWLTEVDAAMPTIALRAVDEHGADLVEVRVSVDGAPIAERLDGRALSIDPGEHLLRIENDGRVVERRLLIREGERDRLVSVSFGPKPGAPPPPGGPATGSTADSGAHGPPTGVWILGGAGIVAMGAGAFFWVRGRSERSDLYATCGVTHSCAQSDVDAARTKVLVGDIAFGVGVVAVGVAVTWALLTPSSASAKTAKSPRSELRAAQVPGGAIVGWTARF